LPNPSPKEYIPEINKDHKKPSRVLCPKTIAKTNPNITVIFKHKKTPLLRLFIVYISWLFIISTDCFWGESK
jgi:hypothetical protein